MACPAGASNRLRLDDTPRHHALIRNSPPTTRCIVGDSRDVLPPNEAYDSTNIVRASIAASVRRAFHPPLSVIIQPRLPSRKISFLGLLSTRSFLSSREYTTARTKSDKHFDSSKALRNDAGYCLIVQLGDCEIVCGGHAYGMLSTMRKTRRSTTGSSSVASTRSIAKPRFRRRSAGGSVSRTRRPTC